MGVRHAEALGRFWLDMHIFRGKKDCFFTSSLRRILPLVGLDGWMVGFIRWFHARPEVHSRKEWPMEVLEKSVHRKF